jgi:hypothetical protein
MGLTSSIPVSRCRTIIGVVAIVVSAGVVSSHALAQDPGGNGIRSGPRGAAPAPRSGVAPRVAVPVGGPWQEFSFTGIGVDARGCAPVDPAGPTCLPGANTVFAGAPPWTFTGPAQLQVTDAFTLGDQFQIFDGGVSQGQTTVPVTTGTCGVNPDTCFATAGVSTGFFTFGPGPHSITIQPTATIGASGAAHFRLVSLPVCTQTVSHAGGMTSAGLNILATVDTTWNWYLFLGNSPVTLASVPLPANTPLTVWPPVSFPFPPSGGVAWLSTLTTPDGGIICADFDLVNTGAAPPGSQQRVPRVPLPGRPR